MGMGGGSCNTPGCEGGPNEDGLEFSYTIGLTTMDYPEVVVDGRRQQVAHACLNLVGEQARVGRPPMVGETVKHVFDGFPGVLIDVTDTSDRVVMDQIYPETAAVQLIWPDWRGRFPWPGGYNRWRCPQPMLGPPPARRAG